MDWWEVVLLSLSLLGNIFLGKNRVKLVRIIHAVIAGVEVYTQSTGNETVKKIIKKKAEGIGVEKALHKAVQEVTE